MENKTMYISGKIAGDPLYKLKFAEAKRDLKKRFQHVISPTDMDLNGIDYKKALSIDMYIISQVDGIYLLKDWTKSPGAIIEHNWAKRLGKEILFQEKEKDTTRMPKSKPLKALYQKGLGYVKKY